jgi:hypothetical protein
MGKTLCDWSKSEIEKRVEELLELVKEPAFYCRKCARVANNPKVLCKAAKLPRHKNPTPSGKNPG